MYPAPLDACMNRRDDGVTNFGRQYSDANVIKTLDCFLVYSFYPLSSTVRKSRDPGILDREELFLQLKIEETFSWEDFFNPTSRIISEVANTNSCATK